MAAIFPENRTQVTSLLKFIQIEPLGKQ
jgi:hypothetical protein